MVKPQNERIGADSGPCRCREYKLSSNTICPHFLPENTSFTPSHSTSCVTRCCVCCPYALLTQNAPQSSAFLGQGRSLHRLGFTPKMGTNPPVPVNPHHSSSSPPSAFCASVSPLARSPTARLLRYPNLSSLTVVGSVRGVISVGVPLSGPVTVPARFAAAVSVPGRR